MDWRYGSSGREPESLFCNFEALSSNSSRKGRTEGGKEGRKGRGRRVDVIISGRRNIRVED
jgi:hypothetical protein